MPDNVGGQVTVAPLEERPPPQGRVPHPQRDHLPDEPEEVGVLLGQRPVDPTDRVVLAPGVVIAPLGAEELVAAQDHRHALREQQGGDEVAGLAAAQCQDLGVSRRPLDAAVPAPVGVGAVTIALAVGLVVLLVVGDEVGQRKAVVAGDEVDRVQRATAVVEVGAAAQPGRQLPRSCPGRRARSGGRRRGTGRSSPTSAGRRGRSDLVEARGVPRLGDQLGVGQQAVLGDHLDHGRLDHDIRPTVAAQDRGQVEAEPIDVRLGHPEAQAGSG